MVCLALLAGCTARSKLLLPGSNYRLTRALNNDLLLPPPVANAGDGPLRLAIGPARRRDCTVAQGPFKLASERGQWILTLPANGWWAQRGPMQLEPEVRPFLAGLGRCLAPREETALQRTLVLSMPSRTYDSLYFPFGFPSPNGLIDLHPRMRLNVSRILRDADNKYTGTRATYLVTEERADASITLRSEGREPGIPARTRAARYWRLHLFMNMVRVKRQRAAMLTGTRSVAARTAVSDAVLAEPEITCEALRAKPAVRAAGRVECFVFEGEVSAGPESAVTANGERKWIPIGLGPAAALPPKHSGPFTLRRLFQGTVREITGDAPESSWRTIPLAPGDELTW